MSLDISDVIARLDALEERWAAPRIVAGLGGVAQDAEASMEATTAHGDVTGATRAGYRAYVVTPDDSGLAVIGGALAAVESRNPGHGALGGGTLAGQYGVVYTCPTDYQEKLETENAGQRAVLGPTLLQYADEATRRAAEGQ
jgi:hypothetical protein